MDRCTALIGALVFVFVYPMSSLAEGEALEAEVAPDVAAPEAPEQEAPYWVLEEFDWGDDEEVVLESVEFDPYFSCKGTPKKRCALISTEVAGEELLARFHHHEGELWQVAILTPDLDSGQAKKHLGRVSYRLEEYVSQKLGEPAVVFALPDRDTLSFGPPRVTHFWSVPALEARIGIGRRDIDSFYLALFFSDPVRGPLAREAHEAQVAASDAKQREKRAKQEQRQRERSQQTQQ